MDQFNWEKIYLQNVDLVYKYLLSICHDKYLAEDLTSETFLQAYRCHTRYNGNCKLSVWLCQIGKHLLYQYYEKNTRQTYLSDDIPDLSAEETVLFNEKLRMLHQNIRKLPELTQEVIRLRTDENLSFAAIAEILGKSETWARVTFYRAKVLLRKGEDES